MMTGKQIVVRTDPRKAKGVQPKKMTAAQLRKVEQLRQKVQESNKLKLDRAGIPYPNIEIAAAPLYGVEIR